MSIETVAKAFAYQTISWAIENAPNETIESFLTKNIGEFTENDKKDFFEALEDICISMKK